MRSLEFIQHDFWHKARGRELSPQVGTRRAYAGIAFTIFSFWTRYFFWEQIFGSLVGALWDGGLWSRILLLLLAAFLAGPVSGAS